MRVDNLSRACLSERQQREGSPTGQGTERRKQGPAMVLQHAVPRRNRDEVSEPTYAKGKTRVGRHERHGRRSCTTKRMPEITACKVGSGRMLGGQKKHQAHHRHARSPENNLDLLSTHVLSARQHCGEAFGIKILWKHWSKVMVEQATQGCREDNNFTSSCRRNCILLPSSVNHHPSNMQIRGEGGVRCYVGSTKVPAPNC